MTARAMKRLLKSNASPILIRGFVCFVRKTEGKPARYNAHCPQFAARSSSLLTRTRISNATPFRFWLNRSPMMKSAPLHPMELHHRCAGCDQRDPEERDRPGGRVKFANPGGRHRSHPRASQRSTAYRLCARGDCLDRSAGIGPDLGATTLSLGLRDAPMSMETS